MPYDWANAMVAGLWATLAMTAYMLLFLKLRWLQLDFAALLGQIVLLPGRRAEALGMALHVASGILFALGYGLVFWGLGIGAQWWNPLLGTVLGVFHWVISMPLVHLAWHLDRQESRYREPDPGVWAIHYGPQEAFFRLGGHMIFGTVVGWLYFLPGTAASWPLAMLAIAVLIAVYTWWNPKGWLSRAIPSGRVWIRWSAEQREHARQVLRDRYERGEIDFRTYQHERRKYGGEP